MTIHIIALMGARQSGKTTVSKLLLGRGYHRMRFAQPLKDMLHAFGLTWAQLDGDQKEVPCDILCGHTPRWAMQSLGTEWRDMLDPRLWSNCLRERIHQRIALDVRMGLDTFIVIDDLRFHHEVEMLKEFGAEIWVIRRAEVEPGVVSRIVSRLPKWLQRVVTLFVKVQLLHPSELNWLEIDPDVSVFNNGTHSELTETAMAILTERRAAIK